MTIHLLKDEGIPLDRQLLSTFTWKNLVRIPISKLDSDAFTKIRTILMNGIEMESLVFQHQAARMNRDLQYHLALVRRAEKFQQTLVNWLLPPDMTPLETTIAYEQVAIEVTAAVALAEPDPYLAQVYRFGLLEDFDHLYRYSALMDRVEGKDANTIVQSYSDIVPGRPTRVEHRHPHDELRLGYDASEADPRTKLHQLIIMSAEQQTLNYYNNIGPTFSDPAARLLYAEISLIEEQHVTQYESIGDTTLGWMDKWLLHEANEVYCYWSCLEAETDPNVRKVWELMLDLELGHLHFVRELYKTIERRDPAEILPETLPEPLRFVSHREFVRDVLRTEVELSARGTEFVHRTEETEVTREYRDQLNSDGSPSELIAAGYVWRPGTELITDLHERPTLEHAIPTGSE